MLTRNKFAHCISAACSQETAAGSSPSRGNVAATRQKQQAMAMRSFFLQRGLRADLRGRLAQSTAPVWWEAPRQAWPWLKFAERLAAECSSVKFSAAFSETASPWPGYGT